MDPTFKLDTDLNFNFDWVIDTPKVSDTEYMWSKNLKIIFLLIMGQYSWYSKYIDTRSDTALLRNSIV